MRAAGAVCHARNLEISGHSYFAVLESAYYMHFHVKYGQFEITVEIENGLVEGRLPRRALNLVPERYNLHVKDLSENWTRARERKPLLPIAPLE